MSESKKIEKFLISVVPTFESASESDFNSQFNNCPDEFIKKYRLKCIFPDGVGSVNINNPGPISSPVAPSLNSHNDLIIPGGVSISESDSMTSLNSSVNEKSNSNLLRVSESTDNISISNSVPVLQKELKEARAKIEALLKIINNNNNNNSSISKEWKDVLRGQYGVPPVLLLLVAIFAFMVGLLF